MIVTKGYGGNSIVTRGYFDTSRIIVAVISRRHGGGGRRMPHRKDRDYRREFILREDTEVIELITVFLGVIDGDT